jgi:hypothetical protein
VRSVSGNIVTLSWSLAGTADGPTAFIIEAGSSAGAANLAVIAIDGSLRSLVVGAPPGVYYVRVRARNNCGTSGPSTEVVVSVP